MHFIRRQVAMALHHREFKIPSDPPEMGDRGNYNSQTQRTLLSYFLFVVHFMT